MFVTFGANRVMVDNITYQRAEELAAALETLEGVKFVGSDDTEDHYQSGAALFDLTYDAAADDRISLDAEMQVVMVVAVVTALSKAIPEISGSSMTTLSGLGAMCFMQFGIGKDLGVILMKLSFLSVFTLMPGLLMSFSSLIDRTHHRSFVSTISAWGRLAVKTRFIMSPLFAVLLVGGFIFSNKCPYVYGQTTL